MPKTADYDRMLVAEGWLEPKKRKVIKKKKLLEMRRWPYADGFVCGNCKWPLRYERIEYKNDFFCRPECAKQKYKEKGRVRITAVGAVSGPDTGRE